jgi:hypothetical protein
MRAKTEGYLMKNFVTLISLLAIITISLPAFSQGIQIQKEPALSYAYISIQGKIFSKN